MNINVYKGFSKEYLEHLKIKPLVETEIENKLDILKLDEEYADLILETILEKRNSDEEYWISYEEFTLSYEEIILRAKNKKISSIKVIENNIYPNVYPINLKLTDEEYSKYILSQDDSGIQYNNDELIKKINKFYTDIIKVNDTIYGAYNNFEIPYNAEISEIKKQYNDKLLESKTEKCDFLVKIGDDIEEYLGFMQELEHGNYEKIAYIKYSETEISKMIFESLKALLLYKNKNIIYKFEGQYKFSDNTLEEELKNIAKNLFNDQNFQFKPMKFYKNPEIRSNEIEEISQSEIMQYIVSEAEKAYDGQVYKDIFMTAPTGAGKSIVFQIPSIYLAEKYKKLIIVIEPLKGLMDEQKNNLEKMRI